MVVSQSREYGGDVISGPKGAPSRKNWTPATPLPLSLASALTVIVPDTVEPSAGDVMVTVGAVRSGGGGPCELSPGPCPVGVG